ncbi:TonB-dependent receptor [Coraliomargarita parva]|uniref:TonB-dependent receptor n=1 Tax=Coraliomargarita parva TaxID=3014050 RepID=UPI0022B39283|nr:TonB-dependent receptor [Coraliomargarita parva]
MQTTNLLSSRILKLGSTCLLASITMPQLHAGELDGYVTEKSTGAALEGAEVSLPELGLKTSTNRHGYYSFRDIEAGDYAIRFRYVGAENVATNATIKEGDGNPVNMQMALSVYELNDFEVSAYDSATARAVNMQRSSENLRDIVASDHFGQFADTNAAEALNRLPGVSVERDQGEGRFVVIRGIDPNLNSVAIDGVALAAPSSGDRSTLLDTIPIEVLDTLEVTKAVLPDQPGDSIGGHINLRTPSAFDSASPSGSLSAAALYSDLVDELGHRITAAYGFTFGSEDQFGLHLTAMNSERTFGSNNVESDEWVQEGGTWVPDDTIEYREYDLVRERTGVSANFEFKPNDDNLFFIRTSWNEYTDTEIRDLAFASFGGNYTSVTDSSFTNDEVETGIELKEREENMRIFVGSIGGEQSFADWTIDYALSFSRAEEDTPYDREAVYEGVDSSTGTVTSAQGYNPKLGASLGGMDYSDASQFELDELTIGEQMVEETDLSAQANFKREFNRDLLNYIKFGGLVRGKHKESDFDQVSADDDAGIETAASFIESGQRNFLHRPIPSLDTSIFNYAENNLPFVNDEIDSIIEDYESDETVMAAYLMGSFALNEWEIIAGARVEYTDFETEGYSHDEDTDAVSPVDSDKDYTNFLPGVHVRRQFNDDLIFRASWTNTIARPTFEQSRAGLVRESNSNGGYDIERGNPDLEPYEAMNFDASLQYYNETYGIFGVAVFYKDIENFIYEQTFDDGNDEVTTYENGDSGNILGLELSYSRQLDFLPGPLSGLSLSGNLTLSDSDADAQRPGGGEKANVEFIKQSDVIGNISLAWEYERFFFRLSGTYRDSYLDELGEESFQDRYVDDFFQVDAYASVRIYKGLSIFAEVNNIFDEPFRAYWGQSGRLSQYEAYGVSGSIGAKWKF